MSKSPLPTYAIVELLIRLTQYNASIGDYKGHAPYDNNVIVKTSTGTIVFPEKLILKQFESPEAIAEAELTAAAAGFNPSA